MMSREQNDRLTRVGPGQPAGRLLRRYWQPVALAEEFDDERVGARPVRAVRLLGEDFVLFRDERGRWGLLDRACPHRGADLAYGRLEDGGLRCSFHGWLFDVQGRCLDTPGEPEGSRLCDRVRQRACPVTERAGVLWAWLGEGEPPAFPELDCFVAPDSHVFAFKGLWACNWLQSLEVGIDPAHASFLHRFFEDETPGEASYGRQFRGASSESGNLPMTKLLREYHRPEIFVEPAPHGLQLTALRRISDSVTHVRMTNQVFPQAFAIPLSDEMTITQFHVPVDDYNNYWYALFTSFGAPVDKALMREQRLKLHELPDYRPRVGRDNQYGFDPREQSTQTYTGMGSDINLGSETTHPEGSSDLELDLTLDQDVTLEDSDIALASEERAESGSDLDVSDSVLDSEDLVLGGSGTGSDVTIGGDSGISLVDPEDSGLALDEPLELAGQEEESLELGEDDMLTLAEAESSQSGTEIQTDEEFLLTPLEEAGEEADPTIKEEAEEVAALTLDEAVKLGNEVAEWRRSGSEGDAPQPGGVLGLWGLGRGTGRLVPVGDGVGLETLLEDEAMEGGGETRGKHYKAT